MDFEPQTLSVTNNRVHAGKLIIEGPTKTRSSRRTLPLDATLSDVLRRAQAIQHDERALLGDAYTYSGYVVVQESGEPYHPSSLNVLWLRLIKKNKLRRIRLQPFVWNSDALKRSTTRCHREVARSS